MESDGNMSEWAEQIEQQVDQGWTDPAADIGGRTASAPGHVTPRDDLLPDMVKACPVALCAVDQNRKIHYANAEFQHLVRLCPTLGSTTHIAVRSGSASLDLRAAVIDVIESGEGRTVHISLPDHAHGLSVLVTPLTVQGRVLLSVLPPRALMIDHRQIQRAVRLRWSLSEREAECALLLGQGMPAKRIAEMWGVSLPTIRTHLQSIREKLGVGSSLEAAAMIGNLSRHMGMAA